MWCIGKTDIEIETESSEEEAAGDQQEIQLEGPGLEALMKPSGDQGETTADIKVCISFCEILLEWLVYK